MARLGLQFRDADAEIEEAAGCTIAELFARYGEPQFRDEERRVMRQLLAADPLVLATGGGAFMDAETRSILRREAVSIWLRCGLPTLLQRVLSCRDRPLSQDSDPAAVMQRLVQERYPTYAEADLVIDSADDEALLPAPHAGLGFAGDAHDLVGADAIRSKQNDLCPPDMLLQTVPIGRDLNETGVVRRSEADRDTGAHDVDSHTTRLTGILRRTLPSGSIH